jgi:hypothetical protein
MRGTGRPDRLSPSGRPPCAFAFLPRSFAAYPRHPDGLATVRGATLSSLGFRAVRHMPGRWIRTVGGLPALPRAASGVSTPIAAYTTVPPGALRRRSVHRLHSSRPSPRDERTPSRTSRPSWRSSRRFVRFSGKHTGAGDFRALISARIRSVHRTPHGRIRARPDASLPPRGSPPSSVLPPRPGVTLWSRALPVHDGIGRRLDRTSSSGVSEHGDRFAPLGATGSYGVLHLATVADSFRPALGASSWFCHEDRARCMRHHPR